MNNDLQYRDIDEDIERILERKGFYMYDTYPVNTRKCEDCGRHGHCEC